VLWDLLAGQEINHKDSLSSNQLGQFQAVIGLNIGPKLGLLGSLLFVSCEFQTHFNAQCFLFFIFKKTLIQMLLYNLARVSYGLVNKIFLKI